ncbi:appr-1-p processing enzyme family protein [Cladochytrium replicatum]|nr:appr-1-p processing enzyme family protein [Cladochytrium replicatum]
MLQSKDQYQKRQLLRSLLTTRHPAESGPIDITLISRLERLLATERARRTTVNPSTLPSAFDRFVSDPTIKSDSYFLRSVSLWRGNIVDLSADAIVNAANSALLGCFRPEHHCIDNAIHDFAGPRLRDDCHAIASARHSEEEPVGTCTATKAYMLPSRFVLHTVGPQVERGHPPSMEQTEQLSSCYWSCLDKAEELGAKTISVCCISTGVYGFPQELGAKVAIETVARWLEEKQSKGTVSIERVVFNVFLESDERIYETLLKDCANQRPSAREPDLSTALSHLRTLHVVNPFRAQIAKIANWLRTTDRILIAAGAGLSAAAGLDYTSEDVFKKHFPVMHSRGFRRMYEFIGFTDWTPELQWGYLLSQVKLARFEWPVSEVYGKLLEIQKSVSQRARYDTNESANGRDSDGSFCITTNADGMFGRNGFPLSRIYTPQGDYARMQCLKMCTPQSEFPTLDYINAAIPHHLDPQTQELTDPSVIPRCRVCNGPVFMNVRGGSWFNERPHLSQRKKFSDWVSETVSGNYASPSQNGGPRLVILEIGVGFNTPGVIRVPMEKILEGAGGSGDVKLVRINAEYPGLGGWGGRGMVMESDDFIGLSLDAGDAVNEIWRAYFEV